MADTENSFYPEHIRLHNDTDFKDINPKPASCFNPKKAAQKEQTTKEKECNRKVSKVRVRVEHASAGVKRARMVKDLQRNTKDNFLDLVMVIACLLLDPRVDHRPKPLKL